MQKINLRMRNDPYNQYGILTVDHRQETNDLTQSFSESEYNKLYNNCVLDILKKVYKANISFDKSSNTIDVDLSTSEIKERTIKDLKIIKSIQPKLYTKATYSDIGRFYKKEMYPLPPGEKQTNPNPIIISAEYPTTHYEFFKYEDFNTFNWNVYYNYLSDKFATNNLNAKLTSFDKINATLSPFNKLVLELKDAFNRLRPFQSSYIEKIPIVHHLTYAGQTAAIPSGHSLQGFVMGALLYLNGIAYFNHLKNTSNEKFLSEMDLLIRVVKDTGHRRIIAGIHYPSDMIASYYVYLNVLKHLNIEKEVSTYTKMLKEHLNVYI